MSWATSRSMASSDASPSDGLPLVAALTATALIAVALPTLIAFNVAPSATFLNQAVAYVGWGGFLLVLGAALVRGAAPKSRAALALLAAVAILALSALIAPLWASLPWPLSLSAAGTVLSAMLVVAVGASVQRAGLAHGRLPRVLRGPRRRRRCQQRDRLDPGVRAGACRRRVDRVGVARPRLRQLAPTQPPEQPPAVVDRRRRSGSPRRRSCLALARGFCWRSSSSTSSC